MVSRPITNYFSLDREKTERAITQPWSVWAVGQPGMLWAIVLKPLLGARVRQRNCKAESATAVASCPHRFNSVIWNPVRRER